MGSLHPLRNLLFLLLGTLGVCENAAQTPAGCRKLKSDLDWPSPAAWKAAMPDIIPKAANSTISGPDYRLRVESVADIQKALKFANDNNIRVSIIATGHDFMGRSSATSGLLIDVSLLGGISVLESFTPTKEGAKGVRLEQKANVITPKPGIQAAVTIGAGVATQALNNALSPSKLFTLGAAHGSVSVAGGWGQLGGHAPLSAQYGLGVDQWLEAKIVTADGQLLIANAVSNPDLFWAIRGGGGGTYGVVVEATIKAHADLPITVLSWWMNSTSFFGSGSDDAVGYLIGQMPQLKEKGVSGYFVPALGTIRGIAIHPGNVSIAQANAIWKPILEKMQSFPGLTKFQSKPYRFKNFKEFFDTSYGSMEMPMKMKMKKRHGPGEGSAPPNSRGLAPIDSHMLSAAHVGDPKITKALQSALGNYAILLVTPGKKFTGEDTSTNPSWRKAVVHVTGVKIPLIMNMDGLRKFAPDMGAYGNEAYYGETDWQRSFWGDNYPKLAQVKTKYDPNMTFWVSPGINAEQWHVVGGRVCKVTSPVLVSKTSIAPATDYQTTANWIMDRELVFGTMDLVEKWPPIGTMVGIQD